MSVDEIIAEYLRTKWRGSAHRLAAELLAQGTPEEAAALVLRSLGRIRESTTFLSDAVSFVPERDLGHIAEAAVARLRNDADDGNASDVLAHVALQSPVALHPHLRALLDLTVGDRSYSAANPWRESEMLAFDDLCEVVEIEPPGSARAHLAWRALLETRTTAAIEVAVRSERAASWAWPQTSLDAALGWVDRARAGDGSIRVTSHPTVQHLVFPSGHLDQEPSWLSTHPTWHLDTTHAPRARFGGPADGRCNGCEGSLHHLLTLDPVPAGVGVTSVSKLSLVACLHCLGWLVPVELFQHDASGGARDVTLREREVPEFCDGPLVETTVHVVDTPRRWRWQEWGMSNGRQSLHRIGGHPSWIQGADIPTCPTCRDPMAFVLQLDSNLPSATMRSYLWGSGGIAYVFWCDPCRVSAVFWQCT